MSWIAIALTPSLLAVGLVGSSAAPEAVSPGSVNGSNLIGDACPTFSWAAVENARSHELVVYRVGGDGKVTGPVLREILPGSASSWTPSLDRCLDHGERYGWSVRSGGDWSEVSLFEIVAAPSPTDVRVALEVLRGQLDLAGATPTSLRRLQQTAEEEPLPRSRRARSDTQRPPRPIEPLSSPSVGSSRTATPLLQRSIQPPDYALSIVGDFNLGGNVFHQGSPFLHSDGGQSSGNTALGLNALTSSTINTATLKGVYNTAVGYGALEMNTEGSYNTATGNRALSSNSIGTRNTAFGSNALATNYNGSSNVANGTNAMINNLGGSNNTAVGDAALALNSGGWFNTAIGSGALSSNNGYNNTALGSVALESNSLGHGNTAVGANSLSSQTSGDTNTAVGFAALSLSTGSRNVALGYQAGASLTSGSDNIFIGNVGLATENDTIRIGSGAHTQAFLGGVFNQVAGGMTPVLIGSNAKLGTVAPSSRRFKKNIRDIGNLTERLHELRVVSFRYTKEVLGSAESQPEFGLVAEEVAQVFPELVVYDAEGKPLSVRYHLLSSMLLNEVQRQQRSLHALWWVLALGALAMAAVVLDRWRSWQGASRGG